MLSRVVVSVGFSARPQAKAVPVATNLPSLPGPSWQTTQSRACRLAFSGARGDNLAILLPHLCKEACFGEVASHQSAIQQRKMAGVTIRDVTKSPWRACAGRPQCLSRRLQVLRGLGCTMRARSAAVAGQGPARTGRFVGPRRPVHCLLAVILVSITPAVLLVVGLAFIVACIVPLVIALPLLALARVGFAPQAPAGRSWLGWRRPRLFRLRSVLWPWFWLFPSWLAWPRLCWAQLRWR
jgi:hypothetical protein